jgi:hypothetical protein
MDQRRVVGLCPWLPWPLSRWRVWTEPVRAERLAALRIGLAAVMLFDVSLSYLPRPSDFFGRGSLGDPAVFPPSARWEWSLLRGVEDPAVLTAALWLWAAATVSLLIGSWTRVSAAAAWLLSTSFDNLNPHVTNAGDQVRAITLFYLMLSPCGAAWSLDALRRRRNGPVYVHPWPLRLLFAQMVVIYVCNGLEKAAGVDWPRGESLYFVLGDAVITRWSYAQVPVPYALTRALTWVVLGWELGFPLFVCVPWLLDNGGVRRPRWLFYALRGTWVAALGFGVLFHLGIALGMEIGGFPFYMLCLYLPLVPWERWEAHPG